MRLPVAKIQPLTRHARCRGVTLIEIMIALTIGLILLAGLVTLLSNVSTARSEIDKSSRQIENGRYAIDLLSDDVRHAGYDGEYNSLPNAPAALPNPCSTGTTATSLSDLKASVALPIQGYDSPTSAPLTCLPADYVPGTDVLVVRRARTVAEAVSSDPTVDITGSLVANRVYIQSNSSAAPIIDVGANAGDSATGAFKLLQRDLTATPPPAAETIRATIRRYLVHIYYISACDRCTGTADTIRTLKRLELGDGTMTTVPLVEGIENMQIEYGIDSIPTAVNANTGYIGDGAPDSYVAAPAASDWRNVMAVRMYLLARNTEPSAGYTDTKTYCLQASCTVSTDYTAPVVTNIKHHVFTAMVRAVNPSSRREIPQAIP